MPLSTKESSIMREEKKEADINKIIMEEVDIIIGSITVLEISQEEAEAFKRMTTTTKKKIVVGRTSVRTHPLTTNTTHTGKTLVMELVNMKNKDIHHHLNILMINKIEQTYPRTLFFCF